MGANELFRNETMQVEPSRNLNDSAIAKFYVNKSVFLTGGTGFVGIATLEKLLYSCEGIKSIYILIRKKKNKTLDERVEDLLKGSSALERVRNEKPEMLKKVIPIGGDITEPKLGISVEDENLLSKEVSVVFHVASIVLFNLKFKDIFYTNTDSARKVLQLCKKMKRLQALIYVSTAYSNSNRDVIAETIYSPGSSIESYYFVADNVVDSSLTNKLQEKRPNNYTLTKALAEYLIHEEKGDIPTSIVRPSVITSSVNEPEKGWFDGMNGANAVIAAIGQGLLRSWYAAPDFVADIIPVDTVVNLMIAAAYDTHNRLKSGDKDVKVFNCCSGLRNPISMKTFLLTCLYYTRKHVFDGVMGYPSLIVTNWRIFHMINIFFLHTIPAAIADFYMWLNGRRPINRYLHKKLKDLAEVLEYFTCNEFVFIDHNVHKLYNSLSAEDQRQFDFDVERYNWEDYLENYVLGLRKYMKSKRKP